MTWIPLKWISISLDVKDWIQSWKGKYPTLMSKLLSHSFKIRDTQLCIKYNNNQSYIVYNIMSYKV